MEEANWKAVAEDHRYEVSDQGQVMSAANRHGGRAGRSRVVNPVATPRGHLQVWIGNRRRYVHRLVLDAFAGPASFPGAEGRHLDGDPSNNRIENLAWGTRQQNSDDKQRHGRQSRGDTSGRRKLTAAQVNEIRDSRDHVAVLAARFGVSQRHVQKLRNGSYWTTRGGTTAAQTPVVVVPL